MTEPASDAAVRSLYQSLIAAWNKRDAAAMAELMALDGNMVGFDGSQMNGRTQIMETVGEIFAHHETAPFITKIREVRFLTPDTAMVRAVAGMVHPGESDIDPTVNAVQSLIAVQTNGEWRVALFQNTPAALHGQEELSDQLSTELRAAYRTEKGAA